MNKKLHTIFLCFFLLSNCFLLYAQKQDFFFEKLTEESGRSLGFITGITQDDKGFLWIATRNGLYRYDGYQYKIFRNRPDDTTSLPFNDITYIYKDNSNILWLRHYDRLIAFRDEKVLKNFKPVTSQHYKLNAKIVEDHNNNLWFGPGEDGLYRYDKKTEETFNYHYLPNTYPPELFS